MEAVLASSGVVDLEMRQQMLGSTVQIVLLAPVLDAQGQPVIIENGSERQMQYNTGEGLGTLARMNNELVIVTHDHWTLLNGQLAKARFYNVNNEMLAEVSGAEFHGLIRSRDGGTMVLTAPAALMTSGGLMTADLGNSQSVGWADAVMVVYRVPETGGVDVKMMVIHSTAEYLGKASYVLQSSEGTIVVPGNSGGGIWQNGRLVGNMWTTMVEENLDDGSSQALNMSRAAQLDLVG